MLLIADAFADGAAMPQGGFSSLLIIGLMVACMYFVIIRPQSKRAKEHRNLLANLQVNDEIVTIGGIYGTLVKVAGDYVVLAVADGTNLRLQKAAIATILPRGTLKNLN